MAVRSVGVFGAGDEPRSGLVSTAQHVVNLIGSPAAVFVVDDDGLGPLLAPNLAWTAFPHAERLVANSDLRASVEIDGRLIRLSPQRMAGELAGTVLLTVTDASDVAARTALIESQERLAMATAVGGLGIWDLELATEVLYCDATWHTIMGVDPAVRISSMSEFLPLIHPDDLGRAGEVTQTAAHMIATGEDFTITYRIIRPDGEVRWIRSAACLIQDDDHRPVRTIGFVIDVTDARRGEEALEQANRLLEQEKELLARQSRQDGLTGLLNRRALDDALNALVERGDPAGLIMLDLDHFKAYNDTHGHIEGDAVLVAFAQMLSSVAQPKDLVARYGGEEFVVVLHRPDDAEALLQRLRDVVYKRAIAHHGSLLGRLSFSAGAVQFGAGEASASEQILRLADEAMYTAKSGGRDQFVVRDHRSDIVAAAVSGL